MINLSERRHEKSINKHLFTKPLISSKKTILRSFKEIFPSKINYFKINI